MPKNKRHLNKNIRMPKISKGFNARAKPYIKAFFVCCIEIKQIVGAAEIR